MLVVGVTISIRVERGQRVACRVEPFRLGMGPVTDVSNHFGAFLAGSGIGGIVAVLDIEVLPGAPGEYAVDLPTAHNVVAEAVAGGGPLARSHRNGIETIGDKQIGYIGGGISAGSLRIVRILRRCPFNAEPAVVYRQRFCPGVSHLVREAAGVALIQLHLESVVAAGANTAVIKGCWGVGVG